VRVCFGKEFHGRILQFSSGPSPEPRGSRSRHARTSVSTNLASLQCQIALRAPPGVGLSQERSRLLGEHLTRLPGCVRPQKRIPETFDARSKRSGGTEIEDDDVIFGMVDCHLLAQVSIRSCVVGSAGTGIPITAPTRRTLP